MDRALFILLWLAPMFAAAAAADFSDPMPACRPAQSAHACAIFTNNLGSGYFAAGKYPQAELLFSRAISLWGAEPDRSEDLPKLYYNLAAAYSGEERYTDAERFYRLALVGYRHESDLARQAATLNRLGEVLVCQKRYKEAGQADREAIAIGERLSPSHPEVGASFANLARMMIARRKFAAAEPLLQRAEQIDRLNFAPDHPRIGYDLYAEGAAAVGLKHYADAERLYGQSQVILDKSLPPNHPDIGRLLALRANVCRLEGRLEQAEPLYRRALSVLGQAWGPESPQLLAVLESYEAMLRARQDYAGAESVEVERTRIQVLQALRNSN